MSRRLDPASMLAEEQEETEEVTVVSDAPERVYLTKDNYDEEMYTCWTPAEFARGSYPDGVDDEEGSVTVYEYRLMGVRKLRRSYSLE